MNYAGQYEEKKPSKVNEKFDDNSANGEKGRLSEADYEGGMQVGISERLIQPIRVPYWRQLTNQRPFY